MFAGRRGFRERRRKKREAEEREDQQENRCKAQTIPHVQLGQGFRMRGTGENMVGGVRFHSIGGAEGARDQSYLLMIRIEIATERRTKL